MWVNSVLDYAAARMHAHDFQNEVSATDTRQQRGKVIGNTGRVCKFGERAIGRTGFRKRTADKETLTHYRNINA